MSDGPTRDTRADDDERELVLEYDLDAAPDKVWRAVTIPALRERWLPGSELAEPEPVSSVTGEEVRYRIRDTEPPFLESSVVFTITPNEAGGTRFRIIHRIDDDLVEQRLPRAANSNRRCLMRAA